MSNSMAVDGDNGNVAAPLSEDNASIVFLVGSSLSIIGSLIIFTSFLLCKALHHRRLYIMVFCKCLCVVVCVSVRCVIGALYSSCSFPFKMARPPSLSFPSVPSYQPFFNLSSLHATLKTDNLRHVYL